MPYTVCPKCQSEQLTPKELVGPGLTVRCENCRANYLSQEPDAIETDDAPPVIGLNDLQRSALLLGALITFVVVVLGGIILASKAKANRAAEATKPTPVMRAETPKEAAQIAKAAEEFNRNVVKVIVGAFALGYLSLFLIAGVWLTRDATRRGANGMTWAVFYFSFQVLARMLSGGLYATPLPPDSALVLVVLIEIVAWCSLAVYFAARRGGSLSHCPRCGQLRLQYLKTCPYCKSSKK